MKSFATLIMVFAICTMMVLRITAITNAESITAGSGLDGFSVADSQIANTLNVDSRGMDELRRNPTFSSHACDRACNGMTRNCYYLFTLELYTVLGAACEVCTPNASNTASSNCQCVLADGVERGVSTVNRMIPGPGIQVCQGDKIVVDVRNQMEGLEATIHWHGLSQRGTQYSDGVPYVTQCPILDGNKFRYQFRADNAGTHYWYSHTGLQRMDGLYGSIVVRQIPSRDPNGHLYDHDLTAHVMLLSDWIHEDTLERYPGRLRTDTGHKPDAILINGRGKFTDPMTGSSTNITLETFTVIQNRRYRFRMINSFFSVCPAQLTIQGHRLMLIASDGQPVRPVIVDTIISLSGERYDFIIKADQPEGAYWIQVKGLGRCGNKRVQQLGILRYYRAGFQPTSRSPTYNVSLPLGVVLNPLDGINERPGIDAISINQLENAAKPIDEGVLKEIPDMKIFLPFGFLFYRPEELCVFQPNTYNRFLVLETGDHIVSLIDGISYKSPPVPMISQKIPPGMFCNGEKRPSNCGGNCSRNCACVHKVDVPLNAVVEVVLINEVQSLNVSYPFHLHGYTFYVIGMGRSPDKNVTQINLKHVRDLDSKGLLHRNFNSPPAKDTIAVPNNGYVVFRFRADNPGYWLLHGGVLFHSVVGMNLVLHVAGNLPPVPQNFPRCGDF